MFGLKLDFEFGFVFSLELGMYLRLEFNFASGLVWCGVWFGVCFRVWFEINLSLVCS